MIGENYLSNIGKLGQIFTQKGASFVHNPTLLNLQSLIMASLVLVVNRAAIANYTAIKAKGTPDGPYRTNEAYRTTIREFLGFTGGFIVLRQIQTIIKNGMGKAMQITVPENPNNYKLFKNLNTWFGDPSKKIDEFKPDFITDLTPEINLKNPYVEKCIAVAKVFNSKSLATNSAKKAYIRQVYKLGPIVLASIPTVALAGVYLEKFTHHSDQVVNFISKHLGSGSKQTSNSNPPVVPTPPHMPRMVVPAFGANAQVPFNHFNAAPSPWMTQAQQRPMPMGYPLR